MPRPWRACWVHFDRDLEPPRMCSGRAWAQMFTPSLEDKTMPIDLNTHGHDWRTHVRDSDVFVALVTPAWHRDRLAQRQYAYARELGKAITLLVKAGTPLPAGADDHTWHVWETQEEVTALLLRIETGAEG